MQWNKRFAWVWAAAGLFAITSMLGACDPEAGPQRMGDGSHHSIPPAGDVEGVTLLVGVEPTVEGCGPERPYVALSGEPKQYTIDDGRVSQEKWVWC